MLLIPERAKSTSNCSSRLPSYSLKKPYVLADKNAHILNEQKRGITLNAESFRQTRLLGCIDLRGTPLSNRILLPP